MSLVLLIGAGLMVRSFQRLQEVDPGFNAERIITMDIALPSSKYPEGPRMVAFFDQLLERVATLPGVKSVAATSAPPLSGGGDILSFA